MSNRSETFGRLLKGAINSIAAYEGKTAPAIEDELGDQIGVAGSTIQRYKAGYLPTEPRVVQILAAAAVRRGYLSRAWLQRFLQAARYPAAEALLAQLADVFGSAVTSSDEGALPGGTLTFLFTDIVGSTTRWEHHPQAMERSLARHDELLRQAIDAYGGQVVKTVGDAFQAVFTTAPAALEAALAAQRALANESWGPIDPIQVRMALHVGMVQQRDGDYFGPLLNRVARLCTAGHGGQILLSNGVQELVRDSLPRGTQLHELGEHRLKDLIRPERIFQVVAPDQPADFPPLRTLDSYTHNLPAQPTPLIGREAEVLAVRDLLRSDNVRLLTLTGPGGIGKTRLALQGAAELLDDFRDGVWFVPLAPIREPQLVAAAIAQALGVKEQGERPLVEQLKAYLREKRALLLLDNFEQVAPAAPLVADLLAAASGLKVLITSREMLHVYGEHEYAVPPLSLPDMQRLPPIERLTQYEAVRLFIERAQAVRPDFAVTTDNAPAVAEICVRLDGLPLAIELAAARGKLFPPKALLARLDRRLSMLTGGPRDLPARQQTLRNTIAWSYDMLDAAEQAIFARLGVFVGGCTLAAAEAVLGDDGRSDAEVSVFIPVDAVLDGVSSLVDQSLLKQTESPDGEPRFVMLETIREYAQEQLEAGGETAALRQRHAGYYLALAEAAHPQLRGAERRMWLERIEGEHNNLRAALTWALKGGDAEIGGRLAVVLAGSRWGGSLWSARDPSEGWRWLQAVLAQRSAVSPAIRARALLLTANSSWQPKDEQERAQACEEALALFRAVGDRSGIAATLTEQGVSAVLLGDYAQAVQHYEASLALYRELGDRHGIATTLHSLGDIVGVQGDTARAVALLEESLALCREQGFVVEAPLVLCALGEVPCVQGDYPRAIALYWEAVALFQHLGDRWNILAPLLNLGWLTLVQGDDGRVRALLEEQVGWFREEATPIGLAHILHVLGAVVNAQGEATQATALLREALILQQQFGRIDLIMQSLERFAGLVTGQDQPIRAARLLGAAEVLRTGTHMKRFGAEQAAYDHTCATVRAHLDEAAFAAAWAEGHALTLEHVIAEALAISA
jgi:predicted ATPase/class 3 adenylate cyclase